MRNTAFSRSRSTTPRPQPVGMGPQRAMQAVVTADAIPVDSSTSTEASHLMQAVAGSNPQLSPLAAVGLNPQLPPPHVAQGLNPVHIWMGSPEAQPPAEQFAPMYVHAPTEVHVDNRCVTVHEQPTSSQAEVQLVDQAWSEVHQARMHACGVTARAALQSKQTAECVPERNGHPVPQHYSHNI